MLQSLTLENIQRWPVSSVQHRIWFMEQLEPGSAANNLCFGLHLDGAINVNALRQSLDLLSSRHEALRTTFEAYNDRPTQTIQARLPPALSIKDLSGRPDLDLNAECYTAACRSVITPFDLSAGPLFRVLLIKLREDSHVLMCVFHHIISDNWSLGLFARELRTCYAAFCSGELPALPPVEARYSDYVLWEQSWLASEEFERKLSAYSSKLRGKRSQLNFLPPDQRSAHSPKAASRSIRVPMDLAAELRSIATRARSTLFTLLLACAHIVLSRYSTAPDILVAIPVAGRTRIELEEIIGPFANLIVVSADLSEDCQFPDLLARVRNEVLDALDFHDLPLDRLVRAVGDGFRDLGASSLFQVMFAAVNWVAPLDSFGPLTSTPYTVESSAAPFDLSVSITEEPDGSFWIRADYKTSVLTDNAAGLLLDRYFSILHRVARQSTLRISELGVPLSKRGSTLEDSIRRPERRVGMEYGKLGEATDGLEDRLADLWEQTLGVRPPTVTASFFDLGGHSLMAVRVTAEVNRVFQRRVPVSLMFQTPTIQGMAAQLRSNVNPASSLVALQERGELPPFFIGGSSRFFPELARAFQPGQPVFQMDVYAMQEKRALAGEPFHTTIPAIASCFLQDILQLQPTGPYYLGGGCEGGILALEIALQLQEQGKTVAFLAQFDTPVRGFYQEIPFSQRILGQSLRALSSGRLLPALRRRATAFMTRAGSKDALAERHQKIWECIWTAVKHYEPKHRFPGEIQLFRAAQPGAEFIEDVALGWEKRATHGVRIHEVPGSHQQWFLHPEGQRVLKRAMAETEAGRAQGSALLRKLDAVKL